MSSPAGQASLHGGRRSTERRYMGLIGEWLAESGAADGSAAGWSARRTLPLRVELVRQWRRRRTQLVLAGLALFPLVLAVLFARNRDAAPSGGARFVDLATGGAVNFALFVVAGNETTRQAISHSMKALIDNPDQMQWLLDNPDKYQTAVEELIRWASPATHF